jgi:anaerobic selenocysteine-containing dehydrogenase
VDLNRRHFLKLAGLTAAASTLPGCEREVGRLVPYVLPDDEIVPGVADWYASTCRECSAGCGIIVRVMEGRAKKIEGNPDHPVNRGKVCVRGQAALQGLYNPDRLGGPLSRIESRLTGERTSISWDHGIDILSKHVRKAGHHTIMVTRPLSGTLAWLLSSFMRAVGGRLYFYEAGAELPIRAAAREVFGIDAWPHYDLAGSDYVLSFGAPFLEHWLSPVAYGIAYGAMRQERPAVRGRLIQIEPRLSLTAASADRWVPIRPGTEGLAALGIGHVLLAEGRSAITTPERRKYELLYGAVSLDHVAAATEIPREHLIRIAREFMTAAAPLVMGGGAAAAHTNGTEAMVAINGLNAIAGNVAKAGGVRFYRPASFESGPPVPWLTERALADMVETGTADHLPALWLLYDVNPIYDLPASIPFRRLFEQADSVVSFSPFLDETTALADVILPDHHPLESWGDHVQSEASLAQVVSLIQPVVSPLHDTRAIGDTILAAAGRLGLPGFPWKDFPALLKERWRPLSVGTDGGADGPEADHLWARSLQQGGWWQQPAPDLAIPSTRRPPAYEAARFDGDEGEFPFFLLAYPSQTLGHGRGANLPWLQELPDTLTTAMWGSWAEINPATARSIGVQQGDVIRVHSRYGFLDVPALHFPGIRPDVLAIPIGQGHTDYGRYASGRGMNPLSILAPLFDERSGALATGATRVRIETTGMQSRVVLLDRPNPQPGSGLLKIHRNGPASS